MALDFEHEKPDNAPDLNAGSRVGEEKTYASSLAGPNGDFSVPTFAEIGLKPATTPHRGGETRALAQLKKVTDDTEYTAKFSKPATAPTAFEPAATTLLSPHLHFGSLSVREFWWRVDEAIKKFKGSGKSSIPTNLPGQLLFRDMYFAAQAALGHTFTTTVTNPKCRFVPWHLPSALDPSTNLPTGTYIVDSDKAEAWFRRWRSGTTGFPWIDALMRQLHAEGWIHHLGRHAVACFLTRGGCYVDWHRGADVFTELLIDHEPACNAGNWQWLSCTAFFAQFYRCYSPIAFPRKWDKNGDFVRRYVPELKDYGEKYIYEPWRAPIADQKKWGCVVKGGGIEEGGEERNARAAGLAVYPKPMFDFAERRETCIQGMKKAYAVGLYGDDKRVLDGSWRALFEDNAEGPTEGKTGLPGAQVEGAEEMDVGADAAAGMEPEHHSEYEDDAGDAVASRESGNGHDVAEAESDGEGDQPQKRSRGRPKKELSKVVKDENKAAAAMRQKRDRGRPKEDSKAEEEQEQAEVEEAHAGKKRGKQQTTLDLSVKRTRRS